MRKGWMFFLVFVGMVLLAGGITLLVIGDKSPIELILGIVIAGVGFVIFWYAAYEYALGSAINSLPPAGIAYRIISTVIVGEEIEIGHILLQRLDADEVLYFSSVRDELLHARPGDVVVWQGDRIAILKEKQSPLEKEQGKQE